MVNAKELARPSGTALFDWPLALEDLFRGERGEWPMHVLGGRSWVPPVDVEETEKEYVFRIELPGMSKEDFKVERKNNALIISGERNENKEEKRKNYLRHEQYHGMFRRVFMLPDDATPDGIRAAHKDGILTVRLHRAGTVKPKSIPVE
ncbi:MAG: Hsp20/alpha crystallin family protein [Elusimicrobia bacterium]|nr:Hsp20/alpha crystallin family protein [Elusimicrobiota bacterium]